MKRTLLIRLRSTDGALERVIRAVSDGGFRIATFTARLSIDRTTFYVTIEVSGDASIVVMKRLVLDLDGVHAVEEEEGEIAEAA